MLELIGDGAQMGFWWIMDHLLFINIFLSILIIFFQRKSDDSMGVASDPVFYSGSGLRSVFASGTELPKRQNV